MPPPVPQPTRRQMLLAGSALLGSGLLAACGQDGEDAASSSVPSIASGDCRVSAPYSGNELTSKYTLPSPPV